MAYDLLLVNAGRALLIGDFIVRIILQVLPGRKIFSKSKMRKTGGGRRPTSTARGSCEYPGRMPRFSRGLVFSFRGAVALFCTQYSR